MKKAPCEECVAIARELDEALAELWLSSDQSFRDAWSASIKLMGGTEEDMQRAEELFPKARNGQQAVASKLHEYFFERNGRVVAAVNRKLTHLALTGHNVPYPVPPDGRVDTSSVNVGYRMKARCRFVALAVALR